MIHIWKGGPQGYPHKRSPDWTLKISKNNKKCKLVQVQNGTEQTIRMIFKLKIYKIKIWATVLLAYVKKQIQCAKKVSFTAWPGYM